MIRRRVYVTGLVQGVFYRDTCRRMAEQHSVRGWVRNRLDGSVEAVFEGPDEAVQRLLRWAERGPVQAEVERVRVVEEPPEGLTGFTVRPTG